VAAGASHSVAVTDEGRAYTWGDSSNGRLGAGLIGGSLRSVSVTSGGKNYTGATSVNVTGGGGAGATATATLSGGSLVGINVTNGGSGYTSNPTVSVIAGVGAGAVTVVTVGTVQSTPVAVDASGVLSGKKIVGVAAGRRDEWGPHAGAGFSRESVCVG